MCLPGHYHSLAPTCNHVSPYAIIATASEVGCVRHAQLWDAELPVFNAQGMYSRASWGTRGSNPTMVLSCCGMQWGQIVTFGDDFEFSYDRKSTVDLVITLYDVAQKEAVSHCTLSFVEVAQTKGTIASEMHPLVASQVCISFRMCCPAGGPDYMRMFPIQTGGTITLEMRIVNTEEITAAPPPEKGMAEYVHGPPSITNITPAPGPAAAAAPGLAATPSKAMLTEPRGARGSQLTQTLRQAREAQRQAMEQLLLLRADKDKDHVCSMCCRRPV